MIKIKQIVQTKHLSNTDFNIFQENYGKALDEMQGDNQEVEVQYNTNTFPNGQVLFSALLIGRKEV